MSKAIWWSIIIVGLGMCALIIYYALPKTQPEPTVRQPPATAQPPAPAEPQIRFPLAQRPPEPPLPALDVSDSTMRNALDELVSDKSLIELLLPQDFVRRIVVTVDNLPRQKLALRLIPLKLPGGKFLVSGKDNNQAMAPDNAARYALYVKLAEVIDAKKLVARFVHYYPLFQQAYQDLGYPKGYFNDRLVEVIDHLLATPDLGAPPGLVRPKVFYLFADPALEALSAGQKILMRIGNDNAARIKAKLSELRGELTRQALKP
ncbi:MAG: DUF3014 domain-containing protein [Burkholderiales bacterium]|nr:DUF3014 domain-containing protein [Burkholderiales bacterium]